MRTAGVVAIVGMLVAAAAGLQSVRETRYGTPPEVEASLYVSGGTLSNLTRGYTALAADLYWIRTIQYYGDLKRRLVAQADGQPPAERFPLLYPLLDNTTTLDPSFAI